MQGQLLLADLAKRDDDRVLLAASLDLEHALLVGRHQETRVAEGRALPGQADLDVDGVDGRVGGRRFARRHRQHGREEEQSCDESKAVHGKTLSNLRGHSQLPDLTE